MPPQVRCIRIMQSCPVASTPSILFPRRCFSTSSALRDPRSTSRTPSKFNLNNLKPSPVSKTFDYPFHPITPQSSTPSVSNVEWEINAEQNAMNKNFRINPAGIVRQGDEQELMELDRWNRNYQGSERPQSKTFEGWC